YSMNVGTTATGVVTGKPISLGGSLGRTEATGRGVFVIAREAAYRHGVELRNARVCIQGFGNVGGTAARLFHQAEARVISVQDHTGTVYAENGLDVPLLQEHVTRTGGVAGFSGGTPIADDEFWGLETEFLIPAALESQLTAEN